MKEGAIGLGLDEMDGRTELDKQSGIENLLLEGGSESAC
jgi:hypothetical protein